MSSATFELYTNEGERLCLDLMSDIYDEICSDALTRKQAVAKIVDAVKKVRAVDEGMCDSEPRYAIVYFFRAAFKSAGFLPLEIDDLYIREEDDCTS